MPELILLLFLLFAVATFGLTIWAVIDIIKQKFRKENDRIIWLIIVLAVSGIGPIIYLAMRNSLLQPEDQREYLPPLDDGLAERQRSFDYNESDDYV